MAQPSPPYPDPPVPPAPTPPAAPVVDSALMNEISEDDPYPQESQEPHMWVCGNCGTGNNTVGSAGVSADWKCSVCGSYFSADVAPVDGDALRAGWARSDETNCCMLCHDAFVSSMTSSGKHHCRDCGKVVCAKCSGPRRKPCAGYGRALKLACDDCYGRFLRALLVVRMVVSSSEEHRSFVTLLRHWIVGKLTSDACVLVDVHADTQKQATFAVMAGSVDAACVGSGTSTMDVSELQRSLVEPIAARLQQLDRCRLPASYRGCRGSASRFRAAWSSSCDQGRKELSLLAALLSDLLRCEFGRLADCTAEEIKAWRCPACGVVSWWECGDESTRRCLDCGHKPGKQPAQGWLASAFETVYGKQREATDAGSFFVLQHCREGIWDNVRRPGLITTPQMLCLLRQEVRRRVECGHKSRPAEPTPAAEGAPRTRSAAPAPVAEGPPQTRPVQPAPAVSPCRSVKPKPVVEVQLAHGLGLGSGMGCTQGQEQKRPGAAAVPAAAAAAKPEPHIDPVPAAAPSAPAAPAAEPPEPAAQPEPAARPPARRGAPPAGKGTRQTALDRLVAGQPTHPTPGAAPRSPPRVERASAAAKPATPAKPAGSPAPAKPGRGGQSLASTYPAPQRGAAGGKKGKGKGGKEEKKPEPEGEYERQMLAEVLVPGDHCRGFEDIGGCRDAKQWLQQECINAILFPDLFSGVRAPTRGILMFGPPGNGKTLLAGAVAKESNSTFFSISAGSLTRKGYGDSEQMVRALFSLAAKSAPSVVFVDEVDGILTKRGGGEHEASRRLKTEFLSQVEGVGRDPDRRVLLLCATNRPTELDDAVLSRLPRRLYIKLPDAETRLAILRRVVKEEAPEEVLTRVAAETEGYSGRDLDELGKEAAKVPLREMTREEMRRANADAGRVRKLTLADFRKALAAARPSTDTALLQQFEKWDKDYGTHQAT
eukprot:TRINITY_DN43199_c0_g1_i1.p1 TRINITY_DN43199_c0_g1~~TRINITY_DN43199_c0_g1_i1.p1  ORF type:complete len:960 (+),score=196.90 TRINITY_DN43199_c0_g1_i1:65-2881(+)